MTLVCSTPETSAGRETVLTDVNMLEKMYAEKGVQPFKTLKFGYDWGGISELQEGTDGDKSRRVPKCCFSLNCKCEAKFCSTHWVCRGAWTRVTQLFLTRAICNDRWMGRLTGRTRSRWRARSGLRSTTIRSRRQS